MKYYFILIMLGLFALTLWGAEDSLFGVSEMDMDKISINAETKEITILAEPVDSDSSLVSPNSIPPKKEYVDTVSGATMKKNRRYRFKDALENYPDLKKELLDKYDVNRDGKFSRNEIKNARKAWQKFEEEKEKRNPYKK